MMSLKPIGAYLKLVWRHANGESDYQRYLEHWQVAHQDCNSQPMSRQQYFAALTEHKWNGIKRCC